MIRTYTRRSPVFVTNKQDVLYSTKLIFKKSACKINAWFDDKLRVRQLV